MKTIPKVIVSNGEDLEVDTEDAASVEEKVVFYAGLVALAYGACKLLEAILVFSASEETVDVDHEPEVILDTSLGEVAMVVDLSRDYAIAND